MEEEKKRMVERIPVQVYLEKSWDGQKASIVFRAKDGSEYVQKVPNQVENRYDNLAVQEL
jgi:hypothetical protein